MSEPTLHPRVLTGVFGPPSAEKIFMSPQTLLERLDGISVTSLRQTWQTEVYSVSDEAGWRWVQLGLRGNPPYTLIVRTLPTEGVEHVIKALRAWLAKPSTTERILSVA